MTSSGGSSSSSSTASPAGSRETDRQNGTGHGSAPRPFQIAPDERPLLYGLEIDPASTVRIAKTVLDPREIERMIADKEAGLGTGLLQVL